VLAPVLARLDRIPGVARSLVEASGRTFILEVAPGTARDAVAAAAREVLGAGAAELAADEAEAQRATRDRGDLWFSAWEILALSLLEGRVVSSRAATAAQRDLGIGIEAARAVGEAVRLELFEALERIHAEGGRSSGGWFYAAWPALSTRAAARAAPALPGNAAARLPAFLGALHAAADGGPPAR